MGATTDPGLRGDGEAVAGQYLTFTLSAETYAVEIHHVKEIIDYENVTAIPKMPPFIQGVINLRGAVVPVIDLSARFGAGKTRLSKRTCIVIMELVEAEVRRDIGVVVDAVCEVIELEQHAIEPPPAFGSNLRIDFIEGMAERGDGFLILLNVPRVLSVSEMTSLVIAQKGRALGVAVAAAA